MNNQQPAEGQSIHEKLFLSGGNLMVLTPAEKMEYYTMMCMKAGIDPMNQPFQILQQKDKNGVLQKESLYLNKGGAQQLNQIHNVSHEIISRENIMGCFVVTAVAKLPGGRSTATIGAVPIENTYNDVVYPMKGEALCNAIMKAETKAKRRATIDLLGLGILDESEIASIPNAAMVDMSTGEILQQAGDNNQQQQQAPPPSTPPQQQAPQGPQTPFNKAYPSKTTVEVVLASAITVKEVTDLYYANAALVDKDPKLKDMFSQRRDELKQEENMKKTAEQMRTAPAHPVQQAAIVNDDDKF